MSTFKLALAVFFVVCAHGFGQTSFWTSSTTPATAQASDSQALTLGLKFYSEVPGTVTGVRFYKGTRNTGTHVGALWSSTGAKLASVTFSGETAYGWQQANFASPVTIAANTTYIVSYSAPYGSYAENQYYGWTGVSARPLHVSGSAPGVYTYGSGALFPSSSWHNTNYWVDVVFKASSSSGGSTPGTYTISGTARVSAATLTLSGTASRSTTADGSGNFSFTGLTTGAYIVAPSKSGYTFSPASASVTINSTSVTGVNFTATAVPNPVQHNVTLSWKASTSAGIKGYNVYRASVAGGAFTKLTGSPMATTSYTDSSVASGRTYYYVTTAVSTSNVESSYSNQAAAVVPYP